MTLYKDGVYDGILNHAFFILVFSSGFHGDLNETYPVGKVDNDSKKLMRVTRQCLDEAIKLCKPGALFRDLGKTMCVSCLPYYIPWALLISNVIK